MGVRWYQVLVQGKVRIKAWINLAWAWRRVGTLKLESQSKNIFGTAGSVFSSVSQVPVDLYLRYLVLLVTTGSTTTTV